MSPFTGTGSSGSADGGEFAPQIAPAERDPGAGDNQPSGDQPGVDRPLIGGSPEQIARGEEIRQAEAAGDLLTAREHVQGAAEGIRREEEARAEGRHI